MSRNWYVLTTILSVLVVLVTLDAGYVWFPRTDSPDKADVVVVLGGANSGLRIARGEQLVKQGFAPTMVTDVGTDGGVYKCRLPVSATCFHPSPFTTQGEARAVEAMAKAKGWTNVLLVISDDQATRARIRFRRCYAGGLRIITVSTGGLQAHVYHTLYEDAALVKAETLQRGC